jgi:hypothetical protein
MATFGTGPNCAIPWCWRVAEFTQGDTASHAFCAHHWALGADHLKRRFVSLSRRRRAIDRLWANAALYDEIVARGRFLKLCHVTLWAREREDACADRLRLDMIRSDRPQSL